MESSTRGRHAAPEPVPEPAPGLRAAGPPAPVQVRDVGYARAGRTILDGVSLRVEPGESLAVLGPSGSGKSSLLALLARLERPDTGSVERGADEVDGLVLQGYGLVSVLTAAENVEAPLQAGVAGSLTRREIRDRAGAVLDAVGLTTVADHLVEELSGGQQQRVAIARALAVRPSVVIGDEITAELDGEWTERVLRLVLATATAGGIVVLATHDPTVAERCTRSMRIVDGCLLA